MEITIIGAVAGGTSAAAKARRNSEIANITIFEQGEDISYSACGLPYYLGGEIAELTELAPRTPDFFYKRYNITVKTKQQVLKINPEEKKLQVRNLLTGEDFFHQYDKLIIATGAVPRKLNVPGEQLKNIFSLRNMENTQNIKSCLPRVKKAVVIGSGFLGLEMVDALLNQGIAVTLVEKNSHLLPSFDADLALYLEKYLKSKGVNLFLAEEVKEFLGKERVEKIRLQSGQEIAADLVITAIGVIPNTELARRAGLRLGTRGGIEVNKQLETSIPDIYAVGDCVASYSTLTGQPLYLPLGTTANKMGRIAGENVTGGKEEFRGILGTGIAKIGEYTVAKTGLSEKEALEQGYQVVCTHNSKPNQQVYYPGSAEMIIKAVANKQSHRLLGVQIFGKQGVDKRIDVFATALSFSATVEDLFHLDLSYAPPYSTTKDPVAYTGMILSNELNHGRQLISPAQLDKEKIRDKNLIIIDVRSLEQYEQSHVEGAISLPLEQLREKLDQLDKEKNVVVYCNGGVSGNSAQNTLLNSGFKRVRNLSGGHNNWEIWKLSQKNE